MPPLSVDVTANLRKAATAIKNADALLICTGAGMGVDSGLGTFRGVNAGVWKPLKAMSMDFSQMSDPQWFETDPRLGWAFWHFRHQAYTKGAPHAGYEIMARWGASKKHGVFSFTSNIDGHWARTAGIGPEKVCECHGTVTRMQGLERDSAIWETRDSDISSLQVPEWDLKAGEKVEVLEDESEEDLWVAAMVGADGATIMTPDGKTPLPSRAVRRPGGTDLMRVSEDSRLPSTATGELARPIVMMFGDGGVNCQEIDAQTRRFEEWFKSLPDDAHLVVVEVGAGTAVATVRMKGEKAARKHKHSTFIRVNLEDAAVDEVRIAGEAIAVPGLGALEAITRLDGLQNL